MELSCRMIPCFIRKSGKEITRATGTPSLLLPDFDSWVNIFIRIQLSLKLFFILDMLDGLIFLICYIPTIKANVELVSDKSNDTTKIPEDLWRRKIGNKIENTGNQKTKSADSKSLVVYFELLPLMSWFRIFVSAFLTFLYQKNSIHHDQNHFSFQFLSKSTRDCKMLSHLIHTWWIFNLWRNIHDMRRVDRLTLRAMFSIHVI